MGQNFADRLTDAINARSPVCVGIDPVYDRLPASLRRNGADEQAKLEAIGEFCRGVLETVAPIVPAVKLQIACFEIYRDKGVKLYFDLVAAAKQAGLIVIGDVKRGDIASTASAYAAGHLGHRWAPDAITVNSYFGADGLDPFISAARDSGSGLFVLVRTSNPSAAAIQDFTDRSGKRLYEHVAECIAAQGSREGLVGSRGFSCLGAVVGATYPDQARKLRKLMPQQIFLVPGYGAQGATAADCAAAFHTGGTGAIVNASRSVIYAGSRGAEGADWKSAVAQAAKSFADDIAAAVRR